jgi:hypothetical protein
VLDLVKHVRAKTDVPIVLMTYYNPILQEYVTTDFLRLLLRADAEEREAKANGRQPEPYLVILDEMNLARVEQYFSDFLSALESGEPIELHNDDDVETGEKSDDVPVPKKVRVPKNLYFTGTVNVDETTYMFSPKVLDRAFTIEFNGIDLMGLGKSVATGGELDLVRWTGKLAPAHRSDREDWRWLMNHRDGVLGKQLMALHELLARGNRHFGYRVAFEVAQFQLG